MRNLVVSPMDVETAGRLPADEDDVERRVRVLLLVVRVLGRELHLQEGCFLRCVPIHGRELLLASARVQRAEKRKVVGADPAQRDRCARSRP